MAHHKGITEQLKADRLAQFGPIIERYAAQFPDTKRDYPGLRGMFGSVRHFVRSYAEHHVQEHGTMPTGPHRFSYGEQHIFPDDWTAYE